LLVEFDEVVDFSFVYEQLKDNYSLIGRESKDPVMMFKILILEYLYCLSDVYANLKLGQLAHRKLGQYQYN
jgi:transposase